jgi:RNA polymerase sigma factor for flagellar operon FliA
MDGKSKLKDAELLNRFVRSNDPEIRNEIVLRFVPLVHFVLSRLGISQTRGQDYEDLVSQASMGLIEAVDRYNPRFGTQFSTYATARVRGKVLDYFRSQDWLSRSARQRVRAVQTAITELLAKMNRSPTNAEIANYLHMELDKVERALVDASWVIISIDSIVESEGDENISLHEVLADENQINPAEYIDRTDLHQTLVKSLKSLPEREQQILALYYYEELTLKEIGAVLNVSESRISQLHARAVLSLRGFISNINADLPIIQNSISKASHSALPRTSSDRMENRPVVNVLIGG